MHPQVQRTLRLHAARARSIASLGFRAQAPQTRCLSLRATPSTTSPALSASGSAVTTESPPDARFEVVGAPYSLLSASLSPSQILHTRRGTLVGLTGKPDNTISTLKILAPLSRLPLRIPFLYQRVISTSPTTALIATKAPNTSFTVLNLDGTKDWMIAQRTGLLAWTGHSLVVKPKWNLKLGVQHWGHTEITGRGLIALVGRGQVYSVELKAGEEFIAHPSNVLAYTTTSSPPPQPYRFKSTSWTLRTPSFGLSSYLLSTKFLSNLSNSETWKTASRLARTVRVWSRRTIFGDRLFVRFAGPGTVLMQSRAAAVSESVSDMNLGDIADEVGARGIENRAAKAEIEESLKGKNEVVKEESKVKTAGVHVASVGPDGKVVIEDVKKD